METKMFSLLSEKCVCIRYQDWKVGMKEKIDMLHYKIRRINYFHNAAIKQMWDVAESSDAGLSQSSVRSLLELS